MISPFLLATGSGIAIDLGDPRPEMIDRRTLAAALAMLCLNPLDAGFLYSVAQRALIVAENLAAPFRVYGLLHVCAKPVLCSDAPALRLWLLDNQGDMVRLERKILNAVWQHFGLPAPAARIAADIDQALARVGASEFLHVARNREHRPKAEAFAKPIRPMAFPKVEELYLDRLEQYLAEARTTYGRARIHGGEPSPIQLGDHP